MRLSASVAVTNCSSSTSITFSSLCQEQSSEVSGSGCSGDASCYGTGACSSDQETLAGQGTPVAEGTFDSQNGFAYPARIAFYPHRVGTYTFELTVSDGCSEHADEVTVTVLCDTPEVAGLVVTADEASEQDVTDTTGYPLWTHEGSTYQRLWKGRPDAADAAGGFQMTPTWDALGTDAFDTAAGSKRSEEHTSELQSP